MNVDRAISVSEKPLTSATSDPVITNVAKLWLVVLQATLESDLDLEYGQTDNRAY